MSKAKERRTLRIYLLIAVLLLAGSSQAATLTVCPVGCEYSSMQAAVDAASSGDTVKVYSGEYNGDVHTKVSGLSIVGVDTGIGEPIIKGSLLNDKNIKISDIIVTGGIRTGKTSDDLRKELKEIDKEIEKIGQITTNTFIAEKHNKTTTWYPQCSRSINIC
jgi:pectin methylesterase-like acyl-CoA thioesterase